MATSSLWYHMHFVSVLLGVCGRSCMAMSPGCLFLVFGAGGVRWGWRMGRAIENSGARALADALACAFYVLLCSGLPALTSSGDVGV